MERKLVEQRSIKDVLNEVLNENVQIWKNSHNRYDKSRAAAKMTAILYDASEAGAGFEIRLNNSAALYLETQNISDEVKKYLTQEEDGNFVIKLQSAKERAVSHSRNILPLFTTFRLHLFSAHVSEGHIWSHNFNSIKIR